MRTFSVMILSLLSDALSTEDFEQLPMRGAE
jgi:hypothetical protein